ncbi:hypothetical protein DICPUDRAFT_52129 [Dictyostelium purpureum]|uniref:Protein kinase domain-containing protein n=1 Tax=Dictyostelium purpureum TaxID=5786 RepID=F0Z756_DICPU|nr:uncharacterized protein DICPUDRAFT_52129 [Dictyostelium purpureum]EGC40181.1 hypothetical protein DICPUDRAFT_52129 [Dictyostelium purpureum]|eukprot:XP_003283250.1 hypothetical protein DICPUDRAFT_52129 [Dictyostelium purpureum]
MESSNQPRDLKSLLSFFEEVKDKQSHHDFSIHNGKKNTVPQVPPRAHSLSNVRTDGNNSINSNNPANLTTSFQGNQLYQQQQQHNNNNTKSIHEHSPISSASTTPSDLLSPNQMGVGRPPSSSIDFLRASGNSESMNKPLRPLSASTSPTQISQSAVQFQNEELIRDIRNERASHQQTKYLLKSLQAENQKLSSEISIWRAKYYKLLTKNQKVKVILDHFQTVMNESDSIPVDQPNGTLSNSNSLRKMNVNNISSPNGNQLNTSGESVSNSQSPSHSIHHQRNHSNSSVGSTHGYIIDKYSTISYPSDTTRTRKPTVSTSTFFSHPSVFPASTIRGSSSTFSLNNENTEVEDLSEEEYYSMLEKRREVSHQILNTERDYAHFLNIIVEDFLTPLKVECYQSNNPFITGVQVKQLFGDIEVILGSSKLLIEDLEKVLLDGSTNSIGLGDVFLKICDYFKLYSPYVKNYYSSISIFNKLKEESHKFQTFIQEREYILNEYNFTDLGSLLILPLTRIGQYTSMINLLFNLTPQTHPDFESFKNAVRKMKSIVDYVKEKIKDFESQNKVRTIQNQMVGKFDNLNLPHRRYIREGLLTEISKNSNLTQYHCFLFNDIFVLSTPIKKSNQYQFKKKISFLDAEVSMISDPEDRPVFQISIPTAESEGSPNMLSLNGLSSALVSSIGGGNGNSSISISSGVDKTKSGKEDDSKNEEKEVYTFIADSNRDREEWIAAIQHHITATKKNFDNRKPEDIEKGGIDFNTSEIKLCEQIGSGGSGCTVHRCTVDGFTCAVKVLKLKNTSEYLVEQFVSEIKIMVKLSNQNIAKYLGHRLTQGQLWLFMEFYPHSLKDIISKRQAPFPATEVIWMALEIAKGLEFLHTQKPPIIHRDLKPGNIMCSLDENGKVCNIRVCDFDTSKEMGSGVMLKTCIGTPCYMAAEVLNVSEENGNGYSLKADIWSFAMLCFEIIALLPPYHQFQHLQSIEMIINGTCPPLPSHLISPQLQPLIELLVTCIDLVPSKRPTATQLVSKLTKMLKVSGKLQE